MRGYSFVTISAFCNLFLCVIPTARPVRGHFDRSVCKNAFFSVDIVDFAGEY